MICFPKFAVLQTLENHLDYCGGLALAQALGLTNPVVILQ